ncbi:MAG: hypothetical protein FJZ56_01565 [Chlamydiae bacterium]|nr:hypothetical protein [Chlamydiota bacterium]
MAKILEGLFDQGDFSKKDLNAIIQRKISDRTICYVLLTCTQAGPDGSMEVEMKYEGEKWLASYLIQSAQGILEEDL